MFAPFVWAAGRQINRPMDWWRKVLPEGIRPGLARLWPLTLTFGTPVTEVLFAGKVDRRGVALGLPGWLARFFPTLDFRNWEKIRGWAQTLSMPDNGESKGLQ